MTNWLNDKQLLQSTIARLDKLSAQNTAQWGSMNPTTMLSHLNDALRIALGMKTYVDTSNWFSKNIVFNVAVYVLPRFPKGHPTAKELAPEKEGSTPKDFFTEREYLKKLMDIFIEREPEKIKGHPLFGNINKQQWADLLVKHFDHHLRQFGV